MKSRWILLLFVALPLTTVWAQSSQKKVLLQQIAALRVYGDYLGKGYSIARDGLKAISNLKEGEVNLHSDYFSSLGLVNSTVGGMSTVSRIIELQQKILIVANGIGHDSTAGLLSDAERAYCDRVRGRLLDECSDELQKLFTLMTEKGLVMEDAQRLEAIEGIYAAMQDNYTFIKGFANDIRLLVIERERSQREVNKSRQLNAIN